MYDSKEDSGNSICTVSVPSISSGAFLSFVFKVAIVRTWLNLVEVYRTLLSPRANCDGWRLNEAASIGTNVSLVIALYVLVKLQT